MNGDSLQQQHQRRFELILTAIQGLSQSINDICQSPHVSRDLSESCQNASKASR